MAVFRDNLGAIARDPNMGPALYASSLAVVVPLSTWANDPVGALFGIGVSAFGISYLEDWMPFPSTYLRSAMVAIGCIGVATGIKRLVTEPITIQQSTPPPEQGNFVGVRIGPKGIFMGAQLNER